MQKYFTIVLFFLSNTSALSQNIDSLTRLLFSAQKKEKADLLLNLSKVYWHKNPDSSVFYSLNAIQLSRNISYARGVAEGYRYIGVTNMYSSKLRVAEFYFDTALKMFQGLQDTPGIAATYNNIGVLTQRDLGRFKESIEAFKKALFLFQKLGNHEGMGSVLNYLGLAYQQQADFQKAIEYLLQGMEVRKKIGDIPGVTFSLARVGDMYQALGQHETALKYYLDALHFAEEKKSDALPDAYGSLGRFYLDLKQYEKAKKYIDLSIKSNSIKGNSDWYHLQLGRYYTETGLPDKALEVYHQVLVRTQKTSDNLVQAATLMELSKVYQGKKDHPTAMKYAKNAYELANRYKEHWIISDAANSLSSLYAIMGNYHKAYHYEKIFRSVTDSVDAVNSRLKLAFLESKNEILEKRSNIDLLNKENQIKDQQLKKEALLKKIFIGGIALILLTAFVLLRNILLKRKNEQNQRELAENELQIERLENEKSRTALLQQATELEMQALRSQMNPHFIFNCLSSINRFILKNESEVASDYLTKFSRLIRMVLNNSKNSLIVLKDELEMLRLYLDLERLRFKNSFDYSISFYNHFDPSCIFIPPVLLQPFAENAIWHGLMHKEGHGTLEVAFELEKDMLICYITDNGIGRKKAATYKSKSVQKQKSLGMQITAGRVALLNKEIEETFLHIEDLTDEDGEGKGTRVILKIKYKESIEAFSATGA